MEFLYACPVTSDAQRTTVLQVWNLHFNYHRSHHTKTLTQQTPKNTPLWKTRPGIEQPAMGSSQVGS